jgi:hypothetical protein
MVTFSVPSYRTMELVISYVVHSGTQYKLSVVKIVIGDKPNLGLF